jgi:hypothetical protein
MERRAWCAVLVCVALIAAGSSAWTSGRPVVLASGERAQAHACIFDHQSLRTAPNTCRPRAKAYPPKVVTVAERAVYDSALTFGIPYPILLAIARCESDLDPRASNGKRFGLFQFAPATFRRAAVELRVESGIVARSYWNALDASYAAGYLFATGQSLSWDCERASG